MVDALDLIAEARQRQERAERDRDHWKERAAFERKRCHAVIALAKRVAIAPPELDEEGRANWEQLEAIVEELADVMTDPYARFDDDEDCSVMNHSSVRTMTVYRLQDMMAAAVKRRLRTEQ